jgi:tetratricopeptide (TPR) repeat protein
MAKGFFSSSITFAKNLSKHASLVASRKESVREAWAEITQDTQKLKYTVTGSKTPLNHRKAAQLAAQGRKAYNKGRFEKAEQNFRHALTYDPEYSLPQLYIGHTLYKLGRIEQAMAAWQRTIEMDPLAEEADTARRKIQHVSRRQADTVEHLKQRLRS